MIRPPRSRLLGRRLGALIGVALASVLAATVCGCAAGVSTVASSTARTAPLYRSASTHVQLTTDDVFEPAVGLLLERDDIEITGLDEAGARCTAVTGDQTLTLRVIEAGPGRSRLSVTVGHGDAADANQELADRLVRDVCLRFGAACEINFGTP